MSSLLWFVTDSDPLDSPDVTVAPPPAPSVPVSNDALDEQLFPWRVMTSASLIFATSIGMLLGLGRRHSTMWRPLNAVAHVLLGANADQVWGFANDVTPTGVLVVLVMSAAAGVAVTTLISSRRGYRGALEAAGMAFVAYLFHLHVVARTPGGLAALLSIGELRALYVAVAIAQVAGMRYAFSSSTGTART